MPVDARYLRGIYLVLHANLHCDVVDIGLHVRLTGRVPWMHLFDAMQQLLLPKCLVGVVALSCCTANARGLHLVSFCCGVDTTLNILHGQALHAAAF